MRRERKINPSHQGIKSRRQKKKTIERTCAGRPKGLCTSKEEKKGLGPHKKQMGGRKKHSLTGSYDAVHKRDPVSVTLLRANREGLVRKGKEEGRLGTDRKVPRSKRSAH